MHLIRRALLAALLCPALGCPKDKAPEPSVRVIPEVERASEAVKARIPAGAVPQDRAVRNIQQGLEQVERKQDEHLQRAAEAAQSP